MNETTVVVMAQFDGPVEMPDGWRSYQGGRIFTASFEDNNWEIPKAVGGATPDSYSVVRFKTGHAPEVLHISGPLEYRGLWDGSPL